MTLPCLIAMETTEPPSDIGLRRRQFLHALKCKTSVIRTSSGWVHRRYFTKGTGYCYGRKKGYDAMSDIRIDLKVGERSAALTSCRTGKAHHRSLVLLQ